MLRLARFRILALLSALFVTFTLVSVDFAEARRGGSFGSRGTRTFQSAPPTRTAPNQAAPVERSMTPQQAPSARQPGAAAQQRPGFMNGLGGSLMRGILIGGLFGMLLGYGFGGLAGALGFLVQLLLVGLVIFLVMRFFRSRNTPAMAGGAPRPENRPAAGLGADTFRREAEPAKTGNHGFAIPRIGGGASAAQGPTDTGTDITLDQADLDTFESRLAEVQAAFSREDHGALRRLSTPEMVSYFSEELAGNAQRGMRNDVSDVRLLQADIAESWREGHDDYATAAFRYEATDVMRDRTSGAVVEGEERPTEIVELWTFVRRDRGDWKLSAIQET